MSLDHFASSDGKKPQQPAHAAAPEETDEDLFNFDDLGGGSAKAAATKQELDAALTKVGVAAAEVASTVAQAKPATAAPAAKPAPLAPAVKATVPTPAAKPAAPAAVSAPVGGASVVAVAAQRQQISATPLVLGLVAALVVTNLTLTIVSWNSSRSVRDELVDFGHDIVDAGAALRSTNAATTPESTAGSGLMFDRLPEGYRTIELAKQRIERGEFARARRALYGLLAVVDRIAEPARAEIEAQAQFTLADSWRAEAEHCATLAPHVDAAVEHESAADASAEHAPSDAAPDTAENAAPATEGHH